MNDLYESKISVKRWIVYDILGNLGWIIYFVCTGTAWKGGISPYSILVLVPAVLMLIGLVELISERVAKLDYVLPKRRLYRGFGALTLGGTCGVGFSFLWCIFCPRPLHFWMLGGSILCAIFAGLLFREYHPVKSN